MPIVSVHLKETYGGEKPTFHASFLGGGAEPCVVLRLHEPGEPDEVTLFLDEAGLLELIVAAKAGLTLFADAKVG